MLDDVHLSSSTLYGDDLHVSTCRSIIFSGVLVWRYSDFCDENESILDFIHPWHIQGENQHKCYYAATNIDTIWTFIILSGDIPQTENSKEN